MCVSPIRFVWSDGVRVSLSDGVNYTCLCVRQREDVCVKTEGSIMLASPICVITLKQ